MDKRAAVMENFKACNHDALQDYDGEQAKTYAQLKLAGLQEAPVHLAVFSDGDPEQGHGLGRKTMPEMLYYSTACMVMSLWLQARAREVGVGWVSILEPKVVGDILEVSSEWPLIAYLCIGYPQTQDNAPELERLGWQARSSEGRKVIIR